MPELPEVETVVRTLEHQVGNVFIEDVHVLYPPVIDNVELSMFEKSLKHQQFLKYERLGKYLLFIMKDWIMVAHMRMEGKFFIQEKQEQMDKHVHLCFHLSNHKELRYHDTRKFGRFYLYPKTEDVSSLPCFKNVGYDVFDTRLKAIDLYKYSRKRTITLKQFLLDQRMLAGIGNIYADEICFRVKLHPETKVHRLSKKDFESILAAARIILQAATKAGGTTIRSYTSSLGVDGRFQLKLKVHAREGQPCYVCQQLIEKKFVGGRGTCFCKQCQVKK